MALSSVGGRSTLNYLSLCTGGGGLDLGFSLACRDPRAACYLEREAFAGAHLVAAIGKGLMDDAPIWSDVERFNARPWRGVVDCIIGGIPCQAHSNAGKRLGQDDERDLWSAARRIIDHHQYPEMHVILNSPVLASTDDAQP